MKLTVAAVLAAVTAVSAQISSPYTDQHGITYQAISHSFSGTTFGIALPTEPTDEFIGQITTRAETGWAGVSFGGGMINNLLWVGWPNAQKEIIGAFRLADSYTVPPLFTTPGPQITPIYTTTAVNATHWTYTFICKNCHKWLLPDGYEQTFDLAGEFAVMGYAGHTSAIPDDPSNPASDIQQHNFFGQFGMLLSEARSPLYEQWKANGIKKPVTTTSTTSTTKTTTTPPPTTTTKTTSTTTKTSTTSTYTPPPSTTTTTPPYTPPPTTVPKWAQCGGLGYNGPKQCVAGTRCTVLNPYYHQCL